MKNCYHCNTENKDNNLYCVSCGSKLEAATAGNTQSNTSTQAASKRSGNRGLKIFFSVIGGILGLLVIIFVLTAIFDTGPQPAEQASAEDEIIDIEDLEKVEMGPDQEKVLSIFGYPDEFIIIFNPDGEIKRAETWIYEAMESLFSFADGKYDSGDRIITDRFVKDSYKVKPEDIFYGMSQEELKVLLGESGDEFIDDTTGLKLVSFGSGIISATFNTDDELINFARLKEVERDG
jgi:hypothetical protein